MRRFRIMKLEEFKWVIVGMLVVIAILAYGDYKARRFEAILPTPTPPAFIQKVQDEIEDTPTLSPRVIEIIQQDSEQGKIISSKNGVTIRQLPTPTGVAYDDLGRPITYGIIKDGGDDADAPKTFADDN